MAYFGRKAKKPLQKPGSGTINQGTAARVERVIGRILDRERPARPERQGHELRASRADRAGRRAR